MKLSSPVFEDGDEIPEKYGYRRENFNPSLKVENVPEEADSLVLIMDDPDALEPAGKIWDHWVMWSIPPEKQEIREDESPGVEGENDYGEIGYGGPNPPDGEHTYVFRLYALEKGIDLSGGSSREELENAMENRVVEEAELRGRYSPV